MSSFEESIEGLRQAFERGEKHPREVVEACRKRFEQVEEEVHALNCDTFEEALENLSGWKWDPRVPLSGIPYVQKDNICTLGVETNCSSKVLEGFVPPYEATVEKRLKEAGFQLIGKGNLDEFGMGSSTEYSAWGPTRNPLDTSRVPGGSSGGSAAAVAAGYASFALGSDTGGSVRQPAAFCGLVGLRPTYGRVSRWGLVAFASSLDQIGPITRTVRDSAIVLSIIEGVDGRDSTLVHREQENYLEHIEDGVGDLRVGVLDVSFADWVDPRVKRVFQENVRWFESHAKSVKEVHLNTFDLLLAAYYIIAPSEASSNLARYDGIRYGASVEFGKKGKNVAKGLVDFYRKNRVFGPEVTRRIVIGTFALSSGYYEAYYLRAQKVRWMVQEELEEIWKEVDIIISPTSPTPAFKLGEKLEDPLEMYRCDLFAVLQPMAGCPAISINGGWTELSEDGEVPLLETGEKDCWGNPVKRLPVGLQLTAAPFGESVLFRAARAFEREHE